MIRYGNVNFISVLVNVRFYTILQKLQPAADGKVLVSKLTYRALNVILDVLTTHVACFE